MKINIKQTPNEIAEEMLQYYYDGITQHMSSEEACRCAFEAVDFAMQFVPEFIGERNPVHTKLTQVRGLLQQKLDNF